MDQTNRIAQLEAELAAAKQKAETQQRVLLNLHDHSEKLHLLMGLLVPDAQEVIAERGMYLAYKMAENEIKLQKCFIADAIAEARTIYTNGIDDKQCAAALDIVLQLGVDISKH